MVSSRKGGWWVRSLTGEKAASSTFTGWWSTLTTFVRVSLERSWNTSKNAATVDKIVVSTGTKNGPARHLYRSLGFEETREAEVAPGLRITFFKKPS